MLTTTQLKSIMPALSAKRNGEYLPFLQAAMTEFAIESAARVAAFVAQLAHESGQFQFMEEIWGPTAGQQRYEPVSSLATTLGNTEPGDGKRFKGRGPIQITGRANYRRFGDLLGTDLVTDPARAAIPNVAFRIAGLFWSKRGLNELADRATDDAFREITRRINGGFNGLADRQKFYSVARTVLGVVQAPAAPAAGQALPLPGAAEEPAFDRGYEAIRAHRRRKARRGTAKSKKSAKPKKTARPKKTAKPKPVVRTTGKAVRSATKRRKAPRPKASSRRRR